MQACLFCILGLFTALLSSYLLPREKMVKREGDVLKKNGNEKLENRKVVRRICTVYAAPLLPNYCSNGLRDFLKIREKIL
jgi:hypothetical protein